MARQAARPSNFPTKEKAQTMKLFIDDAQKDPRQADVGNVDQHVALAAGLLSPQEIQAVTGGPESCVGAGINPP